MRVSIPLKYKKYILNALKKLSKKSKIKKNRILTFPHGLFRRISSIRTS